MLLHASRHPWRCKSGPAARLARACGDLQRAPVTCLRARATAARSCPPVASPTQPRKTVCIARRRHRSRSHAGLQILVMTLINVSNLFCHSLFSILPAFFPQEARATPKATEPPLSRHPLPQPVDDVPTRSGRVEAHRISSVHLSPSPLRRQSPKA